MDKKKSWPGDFQRVCAAVETVWPTSRWSPVVSIVAVSGGADSVALLRVLLALAPQAAERGLIKVGHFQHRLRGVESDVDADFVRDLAAENGVEFVTAAAGNTADRDEASLRTARYDFLARTAHAHGARYVVTGHNADDNAETVLHQMFRGTGVIGLRGIAPHRTLGEDVILRRPLLQVTGTQLRQALRAVGQRWREDSSNASTRYRRNWIRNELLPEVEARYAGAGQRVARLAGRQRELVEALQVWAADWLEGAIQSESSSLVRLRRRALPPQVVVVTGLQQLWDRRGWPRRAMGEHQWLQAARALQRDEPKTTFILPGSLRVAVEADAVEIQPIG